MGTSTIKRQELGNPINVGTVNINTLTDIGWYIGASDGTVSLSGVDAFYCLVLKDGSYIKQFIIGEYSYGNTVFMRYYNGSAWTTKLIDFLSAAVETISVPTTSYDTTKISSVAVKKTGKVISGKATIKASALASGSNQITFAIPGVNWVNTPTSSIWTAATVDDSKNFYATVTNSVLYVRATSSNSYELVISFMGIAQ